MDRRVRKCSLRSAAVHSGTDAPASCSRVWGRGLRPAWRPAFAHPACFRAVFFSVFYALPVKNSPNGKANGGSAATRDACRGR